MKTSPRSTLAFIRKKKNTGPVTHHGHQYHRSNFGVTSQENRYVFVAMYVCILDKCVLVQSKLMDTLESKAMGVEARDHQTPLVESSFSASSIQPIKRTGSSFFFFLLLCPPFHLTVNTHWIFGWSKQYPWILIHLTKWLQEKYINQEFKPKHYQFTRNHALVEINWVFYFYFYFCWIRIIKSKYHEFFDRPG